MRFFDLHCDTLYECYNNDKGFGENDLQVSLDKRGNISEWVQCFAIWIPDNIKSRKALELLKSSYAKLIREYILNGRSMFLCKDEGDIKKALNAKKCAGIFTVEGSAAIGDDLDNIDLLKRLGVKMVTLTWNGSSEIGDGILVENAKGLSRFGKRAIKSMEHNKIIVDISHASEKLFWDVFDITEKPFVASHSNSQKVCPNKRNLTDDQFLAIRNRKGLVGLNFCKEFVSEKEDAGFAELMKHLEHFLSLKGEDTVAIGSDFDGCKTIKDLSNLRDIERFYEYLLRHNYSEELIDKLFFKNSYDFFEKYNLC